MKLNNASSTGGNNQQPPIGDASLSQDPSMVMDPTAMGADQTAQGTDPMSMGADPTAQGADPMAAGGDGTDMGDNGSGDEKVQYGTSIFQGLSPENQDAAIAYMQSMEDSEGNADENGEQQQPMMEQVIFTKKQINAIKENFGPSQDELMKKPDRKELPKKQTRSVKNSPFSPPMFQ